MFKMQQMYLLCGVLIVTLGIATGQDNNATVTQSRDAKALSVFQVVRFPNTFCTGSSTLNGTCYTSSECTNKGGTSSGSCANGFGVCCTFTLGCGSKISENVTYFQSTTSPPAGVCSATVCKCSTDICQLRIDMTTFVINGPSTLTISNFKNLAGSVSTTTGVDSSLATNCLTDTFSVTSPGNGNSPSPICGTNSGYHMYVDASDSCNQMNFQLGPNGIGTTLVTRSWSLKVSQISCYDANKAPQGCTQYFTGITGQLNSYNNVNSYHLANQKQTICIRRARGYCRICYSESTNLDFSVSGKETKGHAGMGCCNYGSTATYTKGWDCVQIPGAQNTAGTGLLNNFCGGKLIAVTAAITSSTTSATVCSRQTPFHIQFQSDAFASSVAIIANKGFKLIYWQSTTC